MEIRIYAFKKDRVGEWDTNFWISVENARVVNVIRVDPIRADSARFESNGAESTRFNPTRSFFIPTSTRYVSDWIKFFLVINIQI